MASDGNDTKSRKLKVAFTTASTDPNRNYILGKCLEALAESLRADTLHPEMSIKETTEKGNSGSGVRRYELSLPVAYRMVRINAFLHDIEARLEESCSGTLQDNPNSVQIRKTPRNSIIPGKNTHYAHFTLT